jgi:5-methylcytosine-specific restriction enzyme subunit McrC
MHRSLTTLREYQTLPYSALDGGEVAELERITERLGIPAFRFYRSELKAQQYVGLVQTSQRAIQILPKIHGSKEANLSYLMLLLRYTRALTIHPVGTAQLREMRGSFFEVWIQYFAQSLNRLLRRQYRRDYVEVEKRTGYLKGKLLVEELRDGREAVTGRYPCRYEVFTPDHLLYQVIKFCNGLLRREARSYATQSLLRENASLLADVTDRIVRLSDLERIHLNRLNRAYEPLLDLCRLLLSQATLNVRAGHIAQLTFLFDMNRLFEAFVAAFLRRHMSRVTVNGVWPVVSVTPQYRLGKLFGTFNMSVDLVLEDEAGHRILLDTKYKMLDEQASQSGLAQSDFYQMYAYAKAGRERFDHVILLYPTAERIEETYRADGVNLYVRTFDPRSIHDVESGHVDVDNALQELTDALHIEV